MARNTPVPLRLVQGSASEIAATTGLLGEVHFNTDGKTLVAYDGMKRGGFPMMRQDMGVVKTGDTMTGALKVPTPLKDVDDNTVATCDWVHDILWGRRLSGLLPDDLTYTLQNMPVGAFLNVPDMDAPWEEEDPVIQALESRIATLELHLSMLPDMPALAAQVSGLSADLAAAKARITELETQAAAQATALETASGKITTLETTTASQGTKITTLETTTASQGTAISTANGKITTLETTTASQGTKITTLETTTASQGTKITTLETTTASQGTAINTANGKITALETKTTSQGTAITNATNRITTLENKPVSVAVTTLPSDATSLINSLPPGGIVSTKS